MSKNGKSQPAQNSLTGPGQAAEYSIIKADLIKVLVLNFFYLIIFLVLYFSNQKSHFLDIWFSKMLHF